MRQFLALEIPVSLRRRLGELQERWRSRHEGWRWVRAEGLHLTMRFLGEVDPAQDVQAREAWRRAAAGCAAFVFRLAGAGRFPDRGRPSVLWIGVEERPAGALGELARALEQAALRCDFAPQPRPFRGHLTLARAAKHRRASCPPLETPGWPDEVRAAEIVLFHSRLHPGGARYTALERFPLGGGSNRVTEAGEPA